MTALTDVTFEADGPIGWITFNRPQYRNAQSWKLLDEFDRAMEMADADAGVVVERGGHDTAILDSCYVR